VIDVGIENGAGVELLREIRTTPELRGIPVLLLSSEVEVRDRVRGLRVGADDYLGKPCDADYLLKRVRDLRHRTVETRAPSDHPPEERPERTLRRSIVNELREAAPAPGSLLERVAAVSGLSRVIAPSTVTRACERAGVDAQSMSRADLRRALPELRQVLSLFVPPGELASRMQAIEALAGSDTDP
jgi:DNA-binding response OmpR family regulator